MFQWFSLFTFVLLSATASFHSLDIPMPKKFNIGNIGLELVLDDKHENNNTNIMLSDSDKIDIEPNIISRRVFKSEHPDKLTDFIKIVIELLNKFDDADLELFFKIMNEEIGKHHYNGCKFYELTDNDALNKFIATKFADIRNITAANIRQKLSKLSNHIENTNYNIRAKEFTDYIDSMYKHDSIKKFNKFLIDINDYRIKTKEHLDLNKIIRNGLRSIIFNHYTKLDYNTRAALKLKLRQYWEYYVTEIPKLRSQLNTTEFNLFSNINEDDGKFYYTKKSKHTSPAYKKEHMTLYPKFVMDWKVINTLPAKPIEEKRPKIATTLEKRVLVEDTTGPNFMTPSHNKQKEKIMKPEAHPGITNNNEQARTTEIAVTQPFIEVVTMGPFVSKTIVKLKRLKNDIQLKKLSSQPDSQIQHHAEDKYTSLNEKSTIIEEGLFAEELEHGDSLIAHRRIDNNFQVPETVPIDKDLFNRLQELENELSKIEMHDNNDTELIQGLKHDTQIIDNTNTKTSQESHLKKDK